MDFEFSDTTFTLSDLVTLSIALATFFVALMTLISQKHTERNTVPLISKESQETEFRILVRFLLKNLVQSVTLWLCLENDKYKSYPSEIHISEQFVRIDNLHLHLFYQYEGLTSMLSRLSISLNQYNSSIDVIAKHLADSTIPVNIMREEVQRFQISGVLTILEELKDFVDKVYPKLKICETEFVRYFNPWKEDSRIRIAFGTRNGEEFKKFQEDNQGVFNKVAKAISNDEFREFLRRFGISEYNQNHILNGAICSVAHQLIGADPRSHPIMIMKYRKKKNS